MKVVVTGANGFIGKPLCGLLREYGHIVKPLIRTNPGNNEIDIGDLTLVGNWSELFSGHDAVVHLAALVHEQNPSTATQIEKVNTIAVETLIHAAEHVGIKRFIFLSTAAVYGSHSLTPFRETDIPSPETDYARSKIRAERLISTFCQSRRLAYTVLRPPMVYGPNAKAGFSSLVRLINCGIPLPLASAANKRSFIYVNNLTHIIEACLHHPATENEIFNVSDLDDQSVTEFVRVIAKHLGRKERLFYLPDGLIRQMAAIIGKGNTVSKLLDPFQLDCSKIRSHINWQPPYTVEQAIEKSLASYRSQPG